MGKIRIRQYRINSPTTNNILQSALGNVRKLGISVPEYLFMYNALIASPSQEGEEQQSDSNICCLINGNQFQLGRTFIYETDQGSDESIRPNITSLSFPNLNVPSTIDRAFPGDFPIQSILVDVVYQEN